jgi:hypothetical protein
MVLIPHFNWVKLPEVLISASYEESAFLVKKGCTVVT